MKRGIIFILGIFLFASACTPLPTTYEYADAEKGFSVTYSSDWIIGEEETVADVVFKSLQEDSDDQFPENVNVIVQRDKESFEEYTQKSIEQIENLFGDIVVLESSSTSVSGHPGHMMVYTGSYNERSLKFKSVWTVVDGTAYVITYTAERDKYDKFYPAAQGTIDSFTLL